MFAVKLRAAYRDETRPCVVSSNRNHPSSLGRWHSTYLSFQGREKAILPLCWEANEERKISWWLCTAKPCHLDFLVPFELRYSLYSKEPPIRWRALASFCILFCIVYYCQRIFSLWIFVIINLWSISKPNLHQCFTKSWQTDVATGGHSK